MSKEDRAMLMQELTVAVRLFQQGSDAMDEAACAAMGINLTDGRCLDTLDIEGRMTAGDLARAVNLSPGAVTTALDRLEQAGYARRVRDPEDRRRVLVEVTPKAQRLMHELYGPLGEAGAKLLADYSDRDLRLMRDFLRAGAEMQEEQAARIRARRAKRSA
jgi:DNA-binding MarR family transcriptional regulator